jgi:hypothetical protein
MEKAESRDTGLAELWNRSCPFSLVFHFSSPYTSLALWVGLISGGERYGQFQRFEVAPLSRTRYPLPPVLYPYAMSPPYGRIPFSNLPYE